jgi:hypothetical protein
MIQAPVVQSSIPDLGEIFGKQQETLRDVAVEMRLVFASLEVSFASTECIIVSCDSRGALQERMGGCNVKYG